MFRFNAREGIFAFRTYRSALEHFARWFVSMPARAFLLFGLCCGYGGLPTP